MGHSLRKHYNVSWHPIRQEDDMEIPSKALRTYIRSISYSELSVLNINIKTYASQSFDYVSNDLGGFYSALLIVDYQAFSFGDTRYYTTGRTVAGSIPDEVIRFVI
jgi:hypothetical protein